MAINYLRKNQAKIILGKKKKENSLIQEILILIPKGLNAPFLEKILVPPLLTQKDWRIQGKNYLFWAINSQKLPFFPVKPQSFLSPPVSSWQIMTALPPDGPGIPHGGRPPSWDVPIFWSAMQNPRPCIRGGQRPKFNRIYKYLPEREDGQEAPGY
jgi:hypothetical protein